MGAYDGRCPPLRLMGEGVYYVSIKVVWMPLLILYYSKYAENSSVLCHVGPSLIVGATSRKRNEPGWRTSVTEIQSLMRSDYERV
jgi:hypothetical protein